MIPFHLNTVLLGMASILAASVEAGAQEVAVVIETREGSRVAGVLKDTPIRYLITGQKEPIEPPLDKVRRLDLDVGFRPPDSRDFIIGIPKYPYHNYALINLLTSEFKLQTELGEVVLPKEKVRTLLFSTKPAARQRFPGTKTTILELPLSQDVPEMILSPDRSSLYFLDRAGARVLRFDTERRALDPRSAEAPLAAQGMTLTPDGKTLYVYSSPLPPDPGFSLKRTAGRILVLDAATLERRACVSLDVQPESMTATGSDRVFILGRQGRAFRAFLADVSKGALVWASEGELSKDTQVLRGSDQAWLVHSPYCGRAPDPMTTSWGDPAPMGRNFDGRGPHSLSSDGSCLLSASGHVHRLPSAPNAAPALEGKVMRYSAVAMDADRPELWISDFRGVLHVHSWPDLKPVKSVLLERRAFRMALDAKARTLYCLMDEDPWTQQMSEYDRAPRGGDFHIYDIDALMRGSK